MNKGITIQQIEIAFENARKVGIKTYASFIYGIPGEEEEDIQLTEDLIEEIKPDFIGINIYAAIPGSELYNYIKEKRLYAYEDNNGVLYLKGHNQRVKKYYSNNPYFKIPGSARPHNFLIYNLKLSIYNILKKNEILKRNNSLLINKLVLIFNKCISYLDL